MRPVLRAVLATAVLAACAAALPAVLGAEINTWTDRNGVIHITNRPAVGVGLTSRRVVHIPAPVPRVQVAEPAYHDSNYDELIRRAATRFDLDFDLVKAVIHAESAFDPRAVSGKGARGLMQLMPSTAQDLGVQDTFDPEQNILGGSRYLKQMLERYNHDLPLGLAAYNAGPSRVDRAGGVPPIAETHDYIRKVKRLMRLYGSTEGSGGRLYRVVKNGRVLITDRPLP
ncbi:lytic transglycosylase domain-containing protein [bacterium]|nr:lytic transglycosylase domain-containing protein [bacterium]